MKYLFKTVFGKVTVYLTAFSFLFLPSAASFTTSKVYAGEESYQNTEKELEEVIEESKAVIAGETKRETVDKEPPMIMHEPLQTTIKQDIQIVAKIEDGTVVKEATLHYRVKGNESFENVKMKKVEGNIYIGVIPETAVSLAGMEYYIEASDVNNNIATDGSKEVVYPILVEGTQVEKNLVTAEKPIYKKWWFWTLAVAATAGGAVALGGAGGGGGSGDSSGESSSGSGGGGTGAVTGSW